MKPLVILLVTFVIASCIIRISVGAFDAAFAGRIAMSLMLVFTAMGHFMFTKGMTMMVPAFIPFKKQIVYFTGILEISAAIGLHFESLRNTTAWLLIIFFILLLPANIKAAMDKIDYQKGNHEGQGKNYLWFRVPLQLLFILWTYFSAIN